jgi:hypothetical protein
MYRLVIEPKEVQYDQGEIRATFEKWGVGENRRQVTEMISRSVCISGEPHKTYRLCSVISQKMQR